MSLGTENLRQTTLWTNNRQSAVFCCFRSVEFRFRSVVQPLWVPWYQQSTYRPTHFFLPVANMVCMPSLPQNMGHQGPFLPALCGDACACSCLCCVHASRLASLGSLRGIGESKPGWPPNSNDPHIHGQHQATPTAGCTPLPGYRPPPLPPSRVRLL